MKKRLLISTLLLFTLIFTSQGQTHEIGTVFSDLNNFGVTYKTGTENRLWRFTALYLSRNDQKTEYDSSSTESRSFGIGAKFGYEYRILLVDNLEFRYGADLSFSFSNYKADYEQPQPYYYYSIRRTSTYTPGINLVLGFNYVIRNKLVIGIEALPYFTYSTGTTTITSGSFNYNDPVIKTKSHGINYGLSSTSVMLSLVYRWGEEE
jgi:hypothetical protein